MIFIYKYIVSPSSTNIIILYFKSRFMFIIIIFLFYAFQEKKLYNWIYYTVRASTVFFLFLNMISMPDKYFALYSFSRVSRDFAFTDAVKKFFSKKKKIYYQIFVRLFYFVCNIALGRLRACCIVLRSLSNRIKNDRRRGTDERRAGGKQEKVTIFQIWINPFRDDPHFILHNSAQVH